MKESWQRPSLKAPLLNFIQSGFIAPPVLSWMQKEKPLLKNEVKEFKNHDFQIYIDQGLRVAEMIRDAEPTSEAPQRSLSQEQLATMTDFMQSLYAITETAASLQYAVTDNNPDAHKQPADDVSLHTYFDRFDAKHVDLVKAQPNKATHIAHMSTNQTDGLTYSLLIETDETPTANGHSNNPDKIHTIVRYEVIKQNDSDQLSSQHLSIQYFEQRCDYGYGKVSLVDVDAVKQKDGSICISSGKSKFTPPAKSVYSADGVLIKSVPGSPF